MEDPKERVQKVRGILSSLPGIFCLRFNVKSHKSACFAVCDRLSEGDVRLFVDDVDGHTQSMQNVWPQSYSTSKNQITTRCSCNIGAAQFDPGGHNSTFPKTI